ncbi:MFS transporter [Streptosporangium lutulentum]|uniref:EmrB/QacA subfamily drug resistance transporter n=1 Tax=Streptosporangium lutulentum TaxID=1461250 RepID=A0ABT9Q4Y4_9ACTN|nr:MFS transporter [Streptosporangium lutulentum]MDP9841753.1 EmrB/QacA subfamily drug resistance transporter [Streptosporangium lutulentum]
MTRGNSPTAPAGGPDTAPAPPTDAMVSVPRGSVAPAVVILVLTQLMFVVDTSIVNVALPDIGRDLDFSSAGLSWVVAAYALTFGGLILLSGKVGSMIGPRRALVLGVTVFVIASIAGGLAGSAGLLVAARALQGVGAAVAAPSVMVLLMGITAPGPQRSRAMAMFVLAVGAGAAIGLLAGGVLTQTLGWQWVMFVNAPIGVLVLLGTLRNLPELERRRTSLDIGGATASILAMVALVFTFTSAADHGWTSPLVLAAFAVALAALAALAACERRHPHPVMPLAFFSSMRSAGPLLSMLVVPAGQVGFLFFTTLLTQQVLGFTPIQTGLALVPFTVGLIATNQLTPRLLPRLGERAIGITGLSGLALGITWMALVAADAGPGTSIVTVLLPSILLGAGAGATFAPVTAVIMHQAPSEHIGAAAGLNQGLQQLGGGMGLAVLTSVLAATGGLDHGLGTTLLATAAFPLAGLILFGVWARRIPAADDAHA